MSATHKNKFSTVDTVLHMALELSEKEWKLAFSTGAAQKPRRRDIPARDIEALRQEIATAKERFDLPAETRVVSCYEAGRDGFWLHRFLLSAGVGNQVVDSSSIQVERRGRRAKTDRLDAEKLLAMLIRWHQAEPHVWRVVNAPSPEEENARQLHRELETLKGEQTAHGNRIKGLLAGCGLTVTINRNLPKWLKHVRLWDGTEVPGELKARVLREFERMQAVNRQIRDLEKERVRRIRTEDKDPGILKMRKLMGLGGIGVNSSWLYVREVFGWRKIKNRRQMGSIVGLTPGGQPSHAVHVDRDRLVMAALPAGKRTEPLVSAAFRPREQTSAADRDHGPSKEAVGGVVEIRGAGRGTQRRRVEGLEGEYPLHVEPDGNGVNVGMIVRTDFGKGGCS
jgi:transposase